MPGDGNVVRHYFCPFLPWHLQSQRLLAFDEAHPFPLPMICKNAKKITRSHTSNRVIFASG